MGKSVFNLAVSGMLVNSDKMYVIGNNIANSRTIAFKSNKMNFKEEFVYQGGQFINGTISQYGSGVGSAGVTSDCATTSRMPNRARVT